MRLEYMTCGYEVDGIHMMGVYTQVHKKVQNRALIQTLTAILKNWMINFYLKKIINGSNPLTLE